MLSFVLEKERQVASRWPDMRITSRRDELR
jgi:hypothetical protein